MMRKKSFFHLCLALGSISLVAQLILITLLLYNESDTDNSRWFLQDALAVSNISLDLGCSAFIINSDLLESNFYLLKSSKHSRCVGCIVSENSVALAVEYSCFVKLDSLLSRLEEDEFSYRILRNHKVLKVPPVESSLPIAVAVKRKFPFVILLLHSREDNFWWYGSAYSDPKATKKLHDVSLSLSQVDFMQSEGAIRKIDLEAASLAGHSFMIPKDVPAFINMTAGTSAHFIECDYKRADMFFRTHGKDVSRGAIRFRHQAWKLLSRVKTLLDSVNVPFWLSSGTCLGFHRQCDFIPYSQDVDIGIFAKDFPKHLISEFVSHNFALKHVFGKPSDSWELSFMYGGIKLDIFFFYEDKAQRLMWNGGTQAKTGKKFKYIFPRFSLCWTEFLDLLVRVPCDTESYIEANYGTDWFTPRMKWNWKSSPPNVQENGVWPSEEISSVVQVFATP